MPGHEVFEPGVPAGLGSEDLAGVVPERREVGVLGPLITPEKSIFLFDPLILLTLLLSLLLWKRFRPEVKAFLIAGSWLLAIYILFYARYFVWSGDFAWGDRYITTPVQLLALISIPLLLRHISDIGKVVRRFSIAVSIVAMPGRRASRISESGFAPSTDQ